MILALSKEVHIAHEFHEMDITTRQMIKTYVDYIPLKLCKQTLSNSGVSLWK